MVEQAKQAAINHCLNKGYSIERLKKLGIYELITCVSFSKRAKGTGKGLAEDFDTMPQTVLVYDKKSRTIHEEAFAKDYFA